MREAGGSTSMSWKSLQQASLALWDFKWEWAIFYVLLISETYGFNIASICCGLHRKWETLHVRFHSSLLLGLLNLRSWKSERGICHNLPLASASKRISPRCGLIFANVRVPSYNRHSGQSEPSRYSARGEEPLVTFHARLLPCTRAQTQRRTPRTPAHGAKPEPCPTGRSCHRGSRLTHGSRMFTHLEPFSLSPCPLLPPTGWISLTQAFGHHCAVAAGDYTCFSPTLSAEGHALRTPTDTRPLTHQK